MKIVILGSRGVPARYGGFETFVQHLAPALVQAGNEVIVINEKHNAGGLKEWKGVKLRESAFRKSSQPVWFYWDSIQRATRLQADIILVCGVGGAIFYPLLGKSKSKLITNVDGLEHLRSKFSQIKRSYVRKAQQMTSKHSKIILADAPSVADYWKDTLHAPEDKLRIITYGAAPALKVRKEDLDSHLVEERQYYLIIARLVPENHIREMIKAFLRAGLRKKLVIVGGLDNSEYVEELLELSDPRLLFTGSIYDKQVLDSLRGGAFAYLHGHSVGGTNPSLLEAMAASAFCICHDNNFNREVCGPEHTWYFRWIEDLRPLLEKIDRMSADEMNIVREQALRRVQDRYSWDRICAEYLELFQLLKNGRTKRN